MTDIRTSNETVQQPRLQQGVFQPSRAEIARVMELRLHLADDDPQSGSRYRWQ